MEINVVILAGGFGKRLFPISSDKLPKQFIKLPKNNLSSFQHALRLGLSITKPSNLYLSINSRFKDIALSQLREISSSLHVNFIEEEVSLNTGKAFRDACTRINEFNNNLTYFLPSDHSYYQQKNFFKTTANLIEPDKINLFAKLSQEFDHRFGYIIPEKSFECRYFKVKRFIEKPNLEQAKKDLKGKYLMNLGIYLARPSVILSEFSRIDPTHDYSVKLSFDKMIVENSKNLMCSLVDFTWEDLGSLNNLYDVCSEEIIKNNFIDDELIKEFNKENQFFSIKAEEEGIRLLRKNGTRSQT